MLAACWFAVLKAGGIAVTTAPLLRPRELTEIIERADVGVALTDTRLAADLEAAFESPAFGPAPAFQCDAPGSLEARMAGRPSQFDNVLTVADDPGHHCVHVRHHRPRQGHRPFPSRHPQRHRYLRTSCPETAARRHLHWIAATGLYLWPRRTAAVSHALRCIDSAARAGDAITAARGHSTVPRHDHRDLAHRLPRDARADWGRKFRSHECAMRVVGGRDAAGRRLRGLGKGHRHSVDGWHRLHRTASRLHRLRGGRGTARVHRSRGARVSGRSGRRSRKPRCPAAPSAAWRCPAQPVADISATSRINGATFRTDGISPATPTRWTKTATSVTRLEPTT